MPQAGIVQKNEKNAENSGKCDNPIYSLKNRLPFLFPKEKFTFWVAGTKKSIAIYQEKSARNAEKNAKKNVEKCEKIRITQNRCWFSKNKLIFLSQVKVKVSFTVK